MKHNGSWLPDENQKPATTCQTFYWYKNSNTTQWMEKIPKLYNIYYVYAFNTGWLDRKLLSKDDETSS